MESGVASGDIVVSVRTVNVLIRIPRARLPPEPPKHVYVVASRRRYRATRVDVTRRYAYYAARIELDDAVEVLDSPRIAF